MMVGMIFQVFPSQTFDQKGMYLISNQLCKRGQVLEQVLHDLSNSGLDFITHLEDDLMFFHQIKIYC